MTFESCRHALVVGAGLAGAAACAALTRKGWRITLLDAAAGPAQAASALPVGMLSRHVTRSPTPLSRLCDLGVLVTRSELLRLVPQGEGWQACEVDNLQHDPGRWPATLVRPGALVQAWLHESLQTQTFRTLWGAKVSSLQRSHDSFGRPCWQAIDDRQHLLAEAPQVVVTAAYGSHAMLAPNWISGDCLPLRPVKGQMSLGELTGDPLADRPQRQSGVFVPQYQDIGLHPNWPTRIWTMGSTYERGKNSTHITPDSHERNAESLAAMQPTAAHALRQLQEQGRLLGWAQVRCASLDRLPLAGAVPDTAALTTIMDSPSTQRSRMQLTDVPKLPGMFTLCALGSRGLTLALPLAQLLAQMMSGETSHMAIDLQRAVDPARFAWRRTRRQPPTDY